MRVLRPDEGGQRGEEARKGILYGGAREFGGKQGGASTTPSRLRASVRTEIYRLRLQTFKKFARLANCSRGAQVTVFDERDIDSREKVQGRGDREKGAGTDWKGGRKGGHEAQAERKRVRTEYRRTSGFVKDESGVGHAYLWPA